MIAEDLAVQQRLNSNMQRDVERFRNREQLLDKVSSDVKLGFTLFPLSAVTAKLVWA